MRCFCRQFGLGAIGGCGDRVSSHGHIINENELKHINIGTTTRADILDMLGQPVLRAHLTRKSYITAVR